SGGIYTIEVTHTAASASANVQVTAFSSDGDVSASCTNSVLFNAANGGNTWHLMGYITNHTGVTQPTITFLMTGGSALTTSARLYIDAFKFDAVDPCLGVAVDVAVQQALIAGNPTVDGSGVVARATNVTA